MRVYGFVILAVLAGCSSSSSVPTAAVSGSVTLDGEPLKEGTVVFTPAQDVAGKAIQAAITNGSYTISSSEGVTVGKNQVSIIATKVVGEEMQDGQEIEKREQYLPAKYNTQTTLSYDVKDGDNQADFELTSK